MILWKKIRNLLKEYFNFKHLIFIQTLGEKEIYDAFKGYYDENDDEDLE